MPSIPKVALYREDLTSDLLRRTVDLITSINAAEYNDYGYLQSPDNVDYRNEARHLGSDQTTINLTDYQKRTIETVATSMASVSSVAALLALYWFCLMRRNYRRDLVLLLILSDLFKSFCYIMFSGVTLTRGPVQNDDPFCQASGYMLQTGLEACDFAVLIISLHMMLQIFPLPSTILGYDGLYNVRYWVYAAWFILPNITASLAFINDDGAYQVQGAWCWLPVRPFWYRLALAWVPRYLITISILCFAIVIYVHVGTEFRIFRRERDRASSADLESISQPGTSLSEPRGDTTVSTTRPQTSVIASSVASTYAASLHETARVSALLQPARDARRHSMPTWTSPFYGQPIVDADRGTQSAVPSRRGSRQVAFDVPSPSEEPLSPLQVPTAPVRPQMASIPSSLFLSPPPPAVAAANEIANLPALEESMTSTSVTAISAMQAAMKTRRRAIRRQVRGLFIYPVAYIVFWIVPFVMHCMNYSDYFALHPSFPIALLASFCTTSLGLVDVIIFCSRELPWMHIAGSDGTFLGSLCFWRFHQGPHLRSRSAESALHDEKHADAPSPGLLGMIKDFTWRRLSSSAGQQTESNRSSFHRQRNTRGGADSKVRERERAQQRLQMERDAFEQRQAEQEIPPTPHSPGVRNWFDDLVEPDENEAMSRRPTWT